LKNPSQTKNLSTEELDALRRRCSELEASYQSIVEEKARIESDLARFKDFFEKAGDVFFELDLKGTITFVNEAACRVFQYSKGDFIGLNYKKYTSKEIANRLFSVFNRIYRSGQPSQVFEYEIIHKGQEIRYQEATTSLIRDLEGKPVGFRAIIRDVTERKKIEAEKKRYQEFFENVAEGCWETDLSGNVIFANEATARTLGYSREEFLSLTTPAFATAGGRQEAVRMFQEVYRSGNPIMLYEHELKRKDGEFIFVDMSVNLIRDSKGKPIGFRGITRDVTERKKMEADLQRYKEFVENINEICFENDLEGNLIFANQAACKMFGIQAEETSHRRINYRDHLSPERAAYFYEMYRDVYRSGIPKELYNYQSSREDGKAGYLDMTISLIRDKQNRPAGFRVIARDITERKKMEEEQERLRRQLIQTEKLEAIGTLAGGIAHDFNNLLMGIQGHASLMLLDIDSTHPNYEPLRAIESQVKSGADLTKQLLGYARGGRYEVQVTQLNALIKQTAALFGRTKKELHIFKKMTPLSGQSRWIGGRLSRCC
jgi:PAS domain S-box-containing protein